MILAVFLNGCSSVKFESDYDTSVDFTQYKTLEYYGWDKGSDALINNKDRKLIEKSFGSEFLRRGIKPIGRAEGGDLVVTLYLVTESKSTYSGMTTHVGGNYGALGYGGFFNYGPGYGWQDGMSSTTFSEIDMKVGTLICSVFDPERKILIWEGVATKKISKDPRKREKNIPRVVSGIMKNFPMKPIKE
jgi:hypothetical protein